MKKTLTVLLLAALSGPAIADSCLAERTAWLDKRTALTRNYTKDFARTCSLAGDILVYKGKAGVIRKISYAKEYIEIQVGPNWKSSDKKARDQTIRLAVLVKTFSTPIREIAEAYKVYVMDCGITLDVRNECVKDFEVFLKNFGDLEASSKEMMDWVGKTRVLTDVKAGSVMKLTIRNNESWKKHKQLIMQVLDNLSALTSFPVPSAPLVAHITDEAGNQCTWTASTGFRPTK